MPTFPELGFSIGSQSFISPADPLWAEPFPVSHPQDPVDSGVQDRLSYGAVFERLADFFRQTFQCPDRTKAFFEFWPSPPFWNSANEKSIKILISLEKHGRLYHPCRFSWFFQNQVKGPESNQVAMTLAVGHQACSHLQNEYEELKHLNSLNKPMCLPAVYGYHCLCSDMAVMMGEWFQGFHEFHYANSTIPGKIDIRVWTKGDAHSAQCLPKKQWYDLYYGVAHILATYYNLTNSRQIFPWHHAAGDFVIKPTDSGLLVRLITVRQYAPLLDIQTLPEPRVLNGWLFFFLNLSIRTRIDRLEGIDAYCWAPKLAVKATLAGVLACSTCEAADFLKYLKSFSSNELLGLLIEILDSYDPHTPDFPLISQNVDRHAQTLKETIDLFSLSELGGDTTI